VNLARDFVYELCLTFLTEAVGRIHALEREEEVFRGRDYLAAKRLSPAVLKEVDGEVRRLLDEAENRAETHLRARPCSLEAVAAALEFALLNSWRARTAVALDAHRQEPPLAGDSFE
jgi:ATP-dependent Zn protease